MDILTYRIDNLATITISTNSKLDGYIGDYERRIKGNGKVEYKVSHAGVLKILNDEPLAPIEGANTKYEFKPVIFEQPTYFFEARFDDNTIDEKSIRLKHRLSEIENKFYVRGHSITGQLSFVNEPGNFHFEVAFKRGEPEESIWLDFMVVSTKMDVRTDYKNILKRIEAENRKSIFSAYAKTKNDAGTTKKVEAVDDKKWAVYFEAAFNDYEKALKRILYQPHQQMIGANEYKRVDRVRHWTPAMAREYVRYGADESALQNHLFVERINQMTIDTPENRFVKYTLGQLTKALSDAIGEIADDNRYSKSFRESLSERHRRFSSYQRETILKRVGPMRGVQASSLVLQMRPGYAEIRVVWQLLNSFFTTDINAGKKMSAGYASIAALYEFWCFIELRDALSKVLEVDAVPSQTSVDIGRLLDDAIKPEDDKGVSSLTYSYTREDKLIAELSFQQTYGNQGDAYAWPFQQRPDIVLRFKGKGGANYTYLFDAKYQIEASTQTNNKDAAPRTALDQMHRYRDAILYRTQNGDAKVSREVVGAYVLFPADEREDGRLYPYEELLKEQNVGAFPFLPDKTEKLMSHLRFLITHIDFDAELPIWLKRDAIPQKGLAYVVGSEIGEESILEIPLHGNDDVDARIDKVNNKIRISVEELGGRAWQTIRFIRFTIPEKRYQTFEVEGRTGPDNNDNVDYDLKVAQPQ